MQLPVRKKFEIRNKKFKTNSKSEITKGGGVRLGPFSALFEF
jgi:hypothetical protein